MSDGEAVQDRPRFAIFRRGEGRGFEEVDAMYAEPAAPVNLEGWPKLAEAGYNDGHETKLLFAIPGFSLTHVWFKSGLPLPRHSHNVDCLYYVVAGSLRMGTDELGPGDGFFIGADVPYAYVPGDQGLEILEFRATDRFSLKFLADNPAFWARAVEEAGRRREGWLTERPPGISSRSSTA
jgi:hypothetical protein